MISLNIKRFMRQNEINISRRIDALALERDLEDKALHSTVTGISPSRETPLIVSLTTFSGRIQIVHKTIESLLNQTVKADRILLWLSEEEFNLDDIPEILKLQEKRGLEVCFCERDLGPYKKYHYTLLDHPDSLIITVDDDILYPVDFIEQLYRAHSQEPDLVHCYRANKFELTARGVPQPYKQWVKNTRDAEAHERIFPTGVCGVLYFPGCFAPEISDVETFLRICPHADDIWLKAMTHKNGVMSKRVPNQYNNTLRFKEIDGSQQISLKRANKDPGTGNDAKFKAVIDYFNLTFR